MLLCLDNKTLMKYIKARWNIYGDIVNKEQETAFLPLL